MGVRVWIIESSTATTHFQGHFSCFTWRKLLQNRLLPHKQGVWVRTQASLFMTSLLFTCFPPCQHCTHLWKIQPLYLLLLSIQHQLLYLPPPKQNGSHWLHCVIEPECEPVVSTVEEPCCIKIGDLKEVIQQKWAIDIPKDIDPLTLDQWKVSVIDELQCEVTTPILPLSSQPALWLNISGPWEVIFWKLQIN